MEGRGGPLSAGWARPEGWVPVGGRPDHRVLLRQGRPAGDLQPRGPGGERPGVPLSGHHRGAPPAARGQPDEVVRPTLCQRRLERLGAPRPGVAHGLHGHGQALLRTLYCGSCAIRCHILPKTGCAVMHNHLH